MSGTTATTTRRPSRGRSHVSARGGRKQLPPIPERSSLSNSRKNKVGGSIVGDGSGKGSGRAAAPIPERSGLFSQKKDGADSGGGHGKKNHAVRAGDEQSRKMSVSLTTAVAAVDSRDDEGDVPASVTASSVGVAADKGEQQLNNGSAAAAAVHQIGRMNIMADSKDSSSGMNKKSMPERESKTSSSIKTISSRLSNVVSMPQEIEMATAAKGEPTALGEREISKHKAWEVTSTSHATAVSKARVISDRGSVASPSVKSITSKSRARQVTNQTIHDNDRSPSPSISTRNSSNSCFNDDAKMMPAEEQLINAITPYASNVSKQRIMAVVGFACDDDDDSDGDHGQAQTGGDLCSNAVVVAAAERAERFKVKNVTTAKSTRSAPGLSWEDYHRAQRSNDEVAAMDHNGIVSSSATTNNNISIDDPYPEMMSIPFDENEEIMDNTSRDTRDQYQLERLRARINKSRAGDRKLPLPNRNAIPMKVDKDSAPKRYKSLRSSRIKTVRNLYQYPIHDDAKRLQQQQQQQPTNNQQQQQQQQQQVQPDNNNQEQNTTTTPSSSLLSSGVGGKKSASVRGSPSPPSITNSNKSLHSIPANNTSGSTIPSLNHGGTIGRSLTSTSVHSSGAQSVSGARSVSRHSGVQSVYGAQSTSGVRTSASRHSGARWSASRRPSALSASSSSGTRDQTASDVSYDLEYRGKLFAKMLHLLHDLSPNPRETLRQDDDCVSQIKDMVIADEGRASCCSVAELKLIQKLTEEEMSRILHEFERNNSLVERKEPTGAVWGGVSDLKKRSYDDGGDIKGNEEARELPPPPSNTNGIQQSGSEDSNEKEEDTIEFVHSRRPMPEKIVYRNQDNNGLSIASKFSDVTSATCTHDEFELDEITTPLRMASSRSQHRAQANPHARLQRSPTGSPRNRHKKSLLPLLSPAAVAAASVAASMSLSGASVGNDYVDCGRSLPCVLESLDKIELDEEEENLGGGLKKMKGKGGEPKSIAVEKEEEEGCNDSIKETVGTSGMAMVKEEGVINSISSSPPTLELVEEANEAAHEAPTGYSPMGGTILRDTTTPSSTDHSDEGNESSSYADEDIPASSRREKAFAAKVLASSREMARRSLRGNKFHDGILSAVAKAEETIPSDNIAKLVAGRTDDDHDVELDEVTSILSLYEVAEAQNKKATEEEEAKVALAAPTVSASLLDELVAHPKKQVTFVEPLSEVDNNKPLCGTCIMQ